MRYFVLLGLSLLVWGCEEDQPPIHHPPRTTDLIGVGVVEADGGEVWVLCQEVDRMKDVEPVGLDESPVPPDPAYRFHSMTVKLHGADGQRFQSIGGGSEDEYGLSYYYRKVADGYLSAGVNFSTCGDNYDSACLPTISVRNEDHQLIRFAQLTCEDAYGVYQYLEVTHIYPLRVVRLINGNLLFYGLDYNGWERITCITEYGEVLWSQEPFADLFISNITSLRNGGYAITDQLHEIVRFNDDSGLHLRDLSFSTTDRFAVQTVKRWESGEYLVAGVELDTPYPHMWTYSVSDSLLHDTTYQTEFCVDSVALHEVGENMLLACMNGGSCDGPSAVRLILLNHELAIVGEASFGGNTHVVLKDVTVGADGSIFLCGAYDRGDGSYSALVTKYTSELDAVWSTTVDPTQ